MTTFNKYTQRLATTVMLAALLLALPGMAAAATYYVNAGTGNDGNLGTSPGAAWKTITHAAATVPAGTSGAPNIIMVAAGFYDVVNTEAFPINFTRNYVSLTGAGSATTTINAGAADALDVDAKGFSISGFTFQDANYAIDISEGGFTVTNNIFDVTVVQGVHADRTTTDLATNFSYPAVTISGNTFKTTLYGVYFYVNIDSDYTTENLTMTIGNVAVTGNTFPVTSNSGIYVSGFYIGDLLNGAATVGSFTVTGNTFTGGDYAVDFFSEIMDIEDTQVSVGNVDISSNTFTNQSSRATDIDYWDVDYVYGSSVITLGNLTVSNNTITSDKVANPNCDGIYINDVAYIYDIYDTSTVTTGIITITNNTVNVNDDALYLYFDEIEYLGEEYWGDTVLVTMGQTNISGNTLTSGNSYGAYIYYYDIAYDTYGQSRVVLEPLTFSNNTVNAYNYALYFDIEYWGESMYEDSSLLVGSVTITDNTLISTNDTSLYYEIDEAAYYMYGNASVDIQATTISNNIITAGSGEALYFYLDDFAYTMIDNSVMTMAPVTVDKNTISATNGDGIYIYYYDDYLAVYMENNASATFGDWIITNNTIDATGGNEGIELDHDGNPYDNYDHTQATYGSFLIDNNTFNPNKDAGMAYGIYLYQEQLADSVYGPSIATFREITITSNRMYNIDSEAIYIEFYDFGYDMTGSYSLTQKDIEIGNNIIDTVSTGIEFSLELYSEESAKVDFGAINIHDNTMTNISGYGIDIYYYNYNSDPGSAMLTIGAPTFTNNIISGNTAPGDGIYLEVENDSDGITFGMPIISGNTISGFDHGMYLEDLEEASLSCNYLDNNTLAGIRFNTAGTNFGVNTNSLVGNSVGLTVDNGNAAIINAENNWWGDKLGPAACASCNGVNPGDMGTVDYTPWLTYKPQQSRCGKAFPWVMFTPATTGMGTP